MSKINKNASKCDLMAKIIVLGNSSVGKTSILSRYTWTGREDQYTLCHTPTIGLDFKTKIVKHGEKLIKLQLWDTAGQQRFRTITDNYYTGVSGIVLVYSVSDRKSFEEIDDWISKIHAKTDESVPKILLGNKCQIGRTASSNTSENRVVETHEGRMLAEKCEALFLEVSAKQNINIQQAFLMLTNRIMQRAQEDEGRNSVMILDKKKAMNKKLDAKTKEKGGCCN